MCNSNTIILQYVYLVAADTTHVWKSVKLNLRHSIRPLKQAFIFMESESYHSPKLSLTAS